jgi:hypothetical protein
LTATRTVADPIGGQGRAASPWRRRFADLWPPLAALLAAWTMIAFRSPYGGARLFSPSSYARWDTGHYLHIARTGYYSVTCDPSRLPKVLPPGDYLCGNIGWFPGYPAAIRGLSEVTRMSVPIAAVVVAWTFWYLTLVIMWRLLADARSSWTRWACLLIAAFFPGQVYFAALFPISLCIATILGCLYLALRTTRPVYAWLGFVAGFVAAYSYLTAIVLAPALLVTGLVAYRGSRRWQAFIPAAGAVAGFGSVLLTMQIAVGQWDAYFVSVKKYNVGAHMPLDTLRDRLRPLWTSVGSARVLEVRAWQTLLALCFVVVVIVVTAAGAVRRGVPEAGSFAARLRAAVDRRISAFDLCFVLMAVGVWLVPYIAGGSASTYRSEAFVVVCVPLLRKLPAWMLVLPLGASFFVAWNMAPYFFNKQLV